MYVRISICVKIYIYIYICIYYIYIYMYITVLIDRRRYVPPIVSPVSTLCSVSDTWRRSPQYDYNMSKMLRYGYAADVAGSGRVFDSEANRLRQEAEAQTLRSASVSVVGFQGLHQFPRSWHLDLVRRTKKWSRASCCAKFILLSSPSEPPVLHRGNSVMPSSHSHESFEETVRCTAHERITDRV